MSNIKLISEIKPGNHYLIVDRKNHTFKQESFVNLEKHILINVDTKIPIYSNSKIRKRYTFLNLRNGDFVTHRGEDDMLFIELTGANIP